MPFLQRGSIEQHEWRDGRTVSWRLRVRAHGRRHRIALGTNHEGWNRERAEVELERVRGQIERGTWEPPSQPSPVRSDEGETLHLTASRWWQQKTPDLTENGRANYRWQLGHILAELAAVPTAELGIREVDEFREALVRKDLSPASVNMVLGRLAQILDDAVEYGLREDNPARASAGACGSGGGGETSWRPTRWWTCSTPPRPGRLSCPPTNATVAERCWRPSASPGCGSAS